VEGVVGLRIGNGLEGRLVLGCVGSATYSLLPALARSLREQLPAVDLAFRGEMLSPEQLGALRDGSIDLALLRPFADLAQSTDVSVTALREEKYVVALPEGHRLARRSRVRVADLRGEDLIVHSGHGRSAMYDAVTTMCRDAGFEPSIRHEVAETSTLVTFVAAALGVAVVPEPVSALVVAGTVYRPLASRARMALVVATRADDESALLVRTLRILEESVARESSTC
jgi:DNA-binding transcriptional LysR family regulator